MQPLLSELFKDGQNGFVTVEKRFKIKKKLEDQSRRRHLKIFDKFVILLIMILMSRLMNLKQKMVYVTGLSNESLEYFAYIYEVKIQKRWRKLKSIKTFAYIIVFEDSWIIIELQSSTCTIRIHGKQYPKRPLEKMTGSTHYFWYALSRYFSYIC